MQFTQGIVPQLYTATGNSGTPGTLLYLLPKGFIDPPATITFANSWSAFAGVYIFLEQALVPGTEGQFATSAWAYLADPRNKGVRFVWFDPPNGSGLLSGTPIAVFEQSPGSFAVSFDVAFQFRNVGLFVAAGTLVAQDVPGLAFTFTESGADRIYLTAAWGAASVNITSRITLPFTGNLAGCLQFSLILSPGNLNDLDVGFRYFYAMPQESPDGSFFLESLRYPVFSEPVVLYANLDPLGPLVPIRTFLAFNGTDAGVPGAPAAAQVGSYYKSTLGDAIRLQPLTGVQARTAFSSLVFSVNQLASVPSAQDPYCLVPRGDFKLSANHSGVIQAMCGLSGVEYVELAPDPQGNVISFFPGNDAYAQGFAPGEPPGYTTLTPPVLPTTSFAVIAAQGQALDYMAQPDQSVLYNYATPTPGQPIFSLYPVPVQAATIPWPPPGALAFPMLPYAGLDGAHLDWYQQMESQVVSPVRRRKLTAVPPESGRLVELESVYSATPQGLLATYASGDVWEQIILAKMAGNGRIFALSDVTGDLLSAFRSNKLFLVISNPAAIVDFLKPGFSAITISSQANTTWLFDLNPAADPGESPWTTYGTIMILKFSDLSIAELAGQTDTWAFADTFNQNPSETSGEIAAIINAASPADADFAAFLNAVNNPDWNGILMLNAQAPLSELPEQLAGLAAGISPDKFFAHHIGINASKINVPEGGGDLDISDSSVFGLINYMAPAPLEQNGNDYQFQVQQLKVLFLNSAVAAFSSVIDLQINTLFHEPANLVGSSGDTQNIMQMYGVYERHVVGTQTIESYTFQTATGQASNFAMTSNVLWSVLISQGQFVTVTSESLSTRTESQFVFWGVIDFKALDPFDIFSFGRNAPDDPPAGLSFAKLVIEMVFDPSVVPVVSVFTFDASQLSFDMAGSVARPGSFYNHFPLTVAGFTQAKDATTPATVGYMGLQSPLTQSSVTYPWFSLNFNLNLGTPGALAAQVGFVASLTVAWSPDSAGYTVFTGLKLPGSSGSKRAIQVQGLFNITFKTLEIIAIQETNTFILVLYNIGFKFLSFTFPPTGQVNFALFGNPDAAPGDTTLGWYLAYAKPASNGTGGTGRSGLLAPPSGHILLDEFTGEPR